MHARCSRLEAAVTLIQIDIDDEALADATRLMGTTTIEETVHGALRTYVDGIRRLEAAEDLGVRGARGACDQPDAGEDSALY
jgi:Arc/MetJ family transcription regulator